jgi:gas vesicle protein
MKSTKLISLFLGIALIVTLAACEQRTDDTRYDDGDDVVIQNNMRDTDTSNYFWTYDRDYTYEQREEFRRDVEQAKAKLNQEITRLENEARTAPEDKQEWYNDQIAELKEKRDDLDEEWGDYNNTTADTWDDFKSSVQSVWEDIEDSWQDVKDEMRDA